VVIDMFLFNAFLGAGPAPHRPLCDELTQTLILRKRTVPALRAVVITDPVNTVYGGMKAAHLERLKSAGVEVVFTRLERLRDSNAAWSSLWRLLGQPWGNSPCGGWVPNPFGGEPVTVRSWLALLNFKANHRKVAIADDGPGLRALITSANPHDGSSAHTNVALVFSGPAARELLRTEDAVLTFSGRASRSLLSIDDNDLQAPSPDACRTRIQILTEAPIADAAIAMIDTSQAGDALDLVMFYFADRQLIRALTRAARRGVSLRVLLDPNKDAFGRTKNGMPNRQVARELVAAGVPYAGPPRTANRCMPNFCWCGMPQAQGKCCSAPRTSHGATCVISTWKPTRVSQASSTHRPSKRPQPSRTVSGPTPTTGFSLSIMTSSATTPAAVPGFTACRKPRPLHLVTLTNPDARTVRCAHTGDTPTVPKLLGPSAAVKRSGSRSVPVRRCGRPAPARRPHRRLRP
jgi:hypothetical protein